ncbi:YibE/F family protein [Lactiplantibacillus garii]|uniref:YibE/F family protein n=1 Tax=Lactiplantibacillus garii TaxID=2306423 RepID=A0A3R8J9U1_9LACO|nr:YibE/F family protein [Lactiplantibacillus garii]RRK11754.1 YibE/F family protein [Lactiplantibacillus garii]
MQQHWGLWLTLAVVLLGLIGVGLTRVNAGLYRQTVAQVTHVSAVSHTATSDEFENKDVNDVQMVTVRILNHQHRGQTYQIKNNYTQSGAMDQAYHRGNQVFVRIPADRHSTVTIQGLKRDTALAFVAWLAIALLLLIMRFNGLMALLSVALNAVLFYGAIQVDLATNGGHVYTLFGVLAVIFAALTLWLVLGWGRQMLVTFGATLVGTGLAVIISLTVFAVTHERGVTYESMQYVTQVPRPLFLVETVLGSLGAVMDESTDIVASLFQLKTERPDIAANQVFKSGLQIGHSIMGPLINVLFLIFMADTFAMTLLYLRNGNNWGYTFTMNMSLGMVQSLISGIGIVLAIPVASWLASRLMPGEVSTR